MYHSLTFEERRQIRKQYGKDNLFKMLYKAISVCGERTFSPEDVWYEAKKAVVQIGEADEDARDIEVQALFADLPTCYCDGNETDVMCVMLAVFFMLLDKHDSVENHPYKEACYEIKQTLKQMQGFEVLYENCRTEENVLEASGKFIEVMDYLDCFMSESSSYDAREDKFYDWDKIIEEAKSLDVQEMKVIELVLSRINDSSGHQYQQKLDELRAMIDEKVSMQYLPSTINTQGGAFVTGGRFQTGVEFNALKRIEKR